jgi:histidinol-phosphatase
MSRREESDLELALRLTDLADALTVEVFRRADLVVETKPDLTPVTEADRAVELVVREVLADARPEDSVVGEEYGTAGSGPRRWIIDPIDGTQNFVRRIPVWATLLALEVDGQPVVGVVSAPELRRRWWAVAGQGAFVAVDRGPAERIHVSGIANLADAQVSGAGLDDWDEHGGRAALMALADRCRRYRGFGDFWSHMLVAEGCCEIGLDPVASLWDLAALAVIVEEAGGRFSDLDGRPGPGGGSGISSNGTLHQAALDVLAGRQANPDRGSFGPGASAGR